MIIWIAIFLALAAIIYFQVWPRLRTKEQAAELNARLDAVKAGWWTRIKVRLDAWKTAILGVLGTIWMMLPDLISQLQAAPWATWLDDFWARAVGAGFYLAMIMTRLSSRPVSAEPVMPVTAPGKEVLVTEAKKTALVEKAKAEGSMDW